MFQQKSFQNEEGAALYLVPTPIGNLEDMTFRAIRLLKEASIIAAEDTRVTKKLCNYFDIHTPVISYHEHNKEKSGDRLIEDLKEGKKIALVSDAGMPTISDPGYELVSQALEAGFPVIPLPGANAAVTALIASGLPSQSFSFYGFLPRQKKDKKQELERLKTQTTTMIFYESPHRLKETVKIAGEILGSRRMVICRELTKKFEEFIRGSIQEVVEWIEETEIKGECCMLIEGASLQEASEKESWWTELTVVEHVNWYIEQKGLTSKEAIKKTAVDRNQAKREIYEEFHIHNER
ncbi:16S rRNA (cytidine(1402)-2'-O)-methyltransferase [Bacillus pinisoli]|uniref:16S rRNA (cytidine(1402)-2'-O)-methyltransferase n=1 Tax=Bacillus pinisoli TaxID=2901866 RepID=UPI001FF538DB|nr:16S rRNA (cytidine(1402)-2'-O)-methyltransferase [Bacillus pinisoli]